MSELVREHFNLDCAGSVVETDAGPVVKGVLICGRTSQWGYDYPNDVWTDDTLKAYEGVGSYTNHNKDGTPDVASKVAWFENVRRRADGLPEGDYHLNPEHQLCSSIVWAAKHNPKFYSMSHQANVEYGTQNGRKVVTKIVGKPISVDLVGRGATTGGLFEGAPVVPTEAINAKVSALVAEGYPTDHATAISNFLAGKSPVKPPVGVKPMPSVKEYLNKLGPKLDVDQLLKTKQLLAFVAESGDVPMSSDAPAADAEGTTGEGGMDSAFLTMCSKECSDCIAAKGDPAKLKKCLARLKKILMTHGELSTDDVDDVEDEEEKKGTVGESAPGKKKTETQHAAPTRADAAEVMSELAAEQFMPSATVLEAAMGVVDKTKRLTFIREQKGLANATKPKSKGRDTVAEGGDGAPVVKTGLQEATEKAKGYAREFQGAPAVAVKK